MVDNSNGTYQVRYRLRSAGEHRLFAVVNGERVYEAGARVEAAHGPLTAADVRARVDGALDSTGQLSAVCGSLSVIIIEVCHCAILRSSSYLPRWTIMARDVCARVVLCALLNYRMGTCSRRWGGPMRCKSLKAQYGAVAALLSHFRLLPSPRAQGLSGR